MARGPKSRADDNQPSLFGGPPADRAASGGHREAARPEGSAPVLTLIDGHALAYRSYFALKQLTTSEGVPTNAVYGFARAVVDELRRAGPGDQLVVAFDAPAPTFRAEAFEEYKAGRTPMPDDLRPQLGLIKEFLELLGVTHLERPGVEADDLIGSLATRGAHDGYDVRVITSDRDSYQLVSENVHVVAPGESDPIGPEQVFERYGVTPAQWVDYRALTGDSSDNLPGVPGIGPVTARQLLTKYGDLDAVLEHLDEVEPERHASLIRAARPELELSRRLSKLVTDLELPAGYGAAEPAPREDLTAFLRSLEFGSVMRELHLTAGAEYADAPFAELVDTVRGGAFQDLHWSYGFTLSEERAAEATIMSLAIAADGSVGTARQPFAPKLAGRVNAVDAKALVVAARRAGAEVTPGDDPLLMAYLLGAGSTDPASLSRRFGAGEWGDSAEARAVAGAELLAALGSRLEGRRLAVYQDLEQPLQDVLAQMELAGIKVDVPLLGELTAGYEARLFELEERLRDIAQDPLFNVASRDQVADLLYRKLGLTPGKRTSTGKLSTAVAALEPLAGKHEAVDLIVEHRELAKLVGTYLRPLAAAADTAGRVHATFQQAVVATGRLSSVNPNLQSIPVRTPVGREIRRAFIAEDGQLLLVADYSQIELRMLAHMAGEERLREAFRAGSDIHAATAATIYGVPLDAVTPEQRRAAKTINFGVLYGMGPQSLAASLGISMAEARDFISTYFENYPRVRAFIDETLAAGRELGYVETIMGRRRYVPELRSTARGVREAAERMAFNMPVQGSAADVMKLAMLELAPALAELGGRLLLQVHDEVVAEVPAAVADDAAGAVGRIMAGVYPLAVPLTARVGLGANWLDAG